MNDPGELRALLAEVQGAGGCAHPVRLAGSTLDVATGEWWEGAVPVACKDRRAAVCPACAERYRADAWHLVAAGLRGGKGVPEGVAGHPALFVTLTAPSFGPVHARVGPERSGACRPRRNAAECPHGVSRSCMVRHGPDDPVLGEPLCAACFDYEGAVLWNAQVGRLWQRTIVLLVRHLARAGTMSERALRTQVRLSYVKVAEFQRRGLVHVHVVLRADGPEGPGSEPPHWVTPELLAGVVERATTAAAVPGVGGTAGVRWGAQGEATEIGAGVNGAAGEVGGDAAGVAAYVAKYATKSSEDSGGLARRLGSLEELGARRVRAHVARLVETAWTLGARPGLEALRLRTHAHTFGYPGHFATKSRRYSTTFGALRAARAAHHRDPGEREAEWRYAGRGYPSDRAAALAEALTRASAGIPRGRPRNGPRAPELGERPGGIPGAGNTGDGAGEPHGDGGVAR